MIKKIDRKAERERRHARVRNKISGTADRPRLCVFRSNNNLFVQVIDDVVGNTLAQASTLDKEVKVKHSNKEAAKEVGALIAKRALEKNISPFVLITFCLIFLWSSGSISSKSNEPYSTISAPL